jgi:hypothetical protein
MPLRDRIASVPRARAIFALLRGRRAGARASAPRLLSPSDYHKPILSQEAGNDLIAAAVAAGSPYLAGRPGTVELDCLSYYLRHRHGHAGGGRGGYPAEIAAAMSNNAGFFPPTTANLDAFAAEYLAAVRMLDADTVWFNPGESELARGFCPDAALIPLRSLEPYYHDRPWSEHLAGKRVLVVHPFAESISSNYRDRRTLLFEDRRVLPAFDLRVIRAVQSIAGQPTAYASWFDALKAMETSIAAEEFDVLVVGAGAYGLPLAAYGKKLGKVAIHLGGATQILFGIKGRRWEGHEFISRLFNDHWTRPLPSETPDHYERVEDGGAYW